MATIKSSIVVEDRASSVFARIHSGLSRTTSGFKSLNNEMSVAPTKAITNAEKLKDSALQTELAYQAELQVLKQVESETKKIIAAEGTKTARAQDMIASVREQRTLVGGLKSDYDKVSNGIRNANDNQERLNNKIKKGDTNAASLVKTIMGLSVIQKVVGMVNGSIDSAISRMDTLNNFPKVMSNLKIDEKQSQAAIQMLSDGLKGLPTVLNDAVSAVQRFIATNNSIGYSTKLFLAVNNAILAGDAGIEMQRSALEQLSQAYSKGKPDMMEWRTLQSAMPAQLQQVAKAMNMTSDQLGENLRNGKTSMSAFMDTIIRLNEEGANGFKNFAEQAKNATGGFATSIANMKSAITRGITDVISNINTALESSKLPTIQTMIVNFGNTMETMLGNIGNFVGNVITLLSPVFNLIGSIGNFFVSNWSLIAPILGGITAMLLIYNGYLAANAIANGIAAVAEGIRNFQATMSAIAVVRNANATLMATNAVYAQTVALAQAQIAQSGFNATLMACPLTWIVIAIIAVIVMIYLLVAAFNKLTDSAVSGTGIVVATISVAGAIVWNTIVGVVNAIFKLIDTVANVFISIIEWILNVCCGGFDSFGAAVANLIGNIISWFLNLGTVVTTIIDAIFGTNWTAGLNSLSEAVQAWGKNENAITLERWDHQLSRIDYTEAANAGYEWGANFESKISDKISGLFKNNQKNGNVGTSPAVLDYSTPAMPNVAGDTGKIANNTDKIADSLDTTTEDLKYIMDLAQRDTINRFTTAEIKINMTNNNNINSDMDIDGVVSTLTEALQEQLMTTAEGCHT